MKDNRHIIASVFLILFSFIQLADLHVVNHDANDVDCEMCQLLPDQIDDDFTIAPQTTGPHRIVVISDANTSHYKSPFLDRHTSFYFQNKAPPFI